MQLLPEGEIQVNEDGNFIMSPETLKKLTNYVEEDEDNEALFGSKKDYCCHNNEDGRCHKIRARNSTFAAVKCMGHYVGRPVSSHRGDCNH